jgi:hypothetical protein
MNILQARLIVIGLEAEIKFEGKFQLTAEPAMKTLTRLAGFDAYGTFGRGVKGRQKALAWLKETLALPENAQAVADLEGDDDDDEGGRA